jgi:carbon storage regulator
MLVLSRKKNESIIIGDNIEIVVVDVKGEQVKIGIKAPREVTVHRAEVYEEIQKENLEAANVAKITGLGALFKKVKK